MTASIDWLINYWLIEHPDVYGIIMFGAGLMVGMVITAWIATRTSKRDYEGDNSK